MTDNSDTDTCNATTVAGDQCDNPAGDNGACWIPSHNPDAGDDVDNPHGRPSKIETHRDDILEAARLGATKEGCARAAGVDKQTLYNWLDEYPDFFDAFKRARSEGERRRLRDADDSGSRFVLERSFGYTKTETHEHTGEGGGPIEVTFQEQVVETPYSDRDGEVAVEAVEDATATGGDP